MQNSKFYISSLVATLVCLLTTAPIEGQESRSPAFQVLDEVRIEQRIGGQVPLGLTFTDASGIEVKLGQLVKDRPVILSMVYYECPMLCTQVLNGLLSSVKTMKFNIGNEFDVVTVSFDPDEGTELARAKKASYLESYGRPGAEKGWHFLTGDSTSIHVLTESVGFHYVYQADVDQFAHGAVVIVLNPDGVVSQYHFGIEYAPRDLRLAVVEASSGELGTLVDQILLYCFHYDPTVGKYGVTILNVIRLAGGLTVGVMAFGIRYLLRKEKRSKFQNGRKAFHV
jgi:protein SCO1/2